MSLRKILMASGMALVLPAGAAVAQTGGYQTVQPGQTAFDGPYLGLEGGYSDYDAVDGMTGGIYGGVGQTFPNRLYLGVEGNLGYSGADGGAGAPGTSVDVNETYGVAFRPGYLLNENTLLYTRIGYQRTDFEASSPTGGNSSTRDGVRAGIGAEFAMAQNFLARAEYNHTWNNSFNAQGSSVGTNEHGIRFGGAFTF